MPHWTLEACIVTSLDDIDEENECSSPVDPVEDFGFASFATCSSSRHFGICRICVDSVEEPNPLHFIAGAARGEVMENFPEPYFNQQNLASSSSKGPTIDGRIKPDLVAPGENILSADAWPIEPRDQECSSSIPLVESIYGMSGTSMATPSVSGAAGLCPCWIILCFVICSCPV